MNNAGVSLDGELVPGTVQGCYGRHPAHRISKTSLNALTRMLAAKLAGTGVLVDAADPGRPRSGMGGLFAEPGPPPW